MTQPDFSFERRLWKKGFKYVVGVDEVGRGAFAGPLVVGGVIFPKRIVEIDGLNDSKLLKPRFREELAREIEAKALVWDVTEVSDGVINRLGIAKATAKAMRKTISDLARKGYPPDFVLVDYFYIPYLRGLGLKNQKAIKHGDQRSFSIAAASIMAKVYRDRVMRSLGRKPRYQTYGWGKNKGYSSKLHQKAILRYGMTRYHRKQYVATWREKKKLKS